MRPSEFTPVTISAIEDRTNDVRILTLMPDKPFTYRAGQYLEVDAAGYEPRPYSIASRPHADGRIVLHVRDTGAGLSAHLVREAKIGDIIAIDGPFGNLNADFARNRPVLMVAGGTGIAPMLALAQDIIKRHLTEDGITLVYGAREERDIYCRPELDALLATGEVTLHTVTGPQTPDLEIKRLGLPLAHHIVYVSGPDPMMQSVHNALLNHLADRNRIFTDADIENLQKALP